MTDNTIVAALAKALPELESAKKNAENPHLRSKYANLSAVMAAVEPIRAHGLWYRQRSHDKPDGACIETIYLHDSGAELSAGLTFVKADKQNPQGFGSAMTYCRRYSLQTAFGLDAEDDDGHAASQPKKEAAPAPELVSEEQRQELQMLLEKHGVNAIDFCRVGEVKTIKDLHAANFEKAKSWIIKNTKRENA